jgi:hypothetical protein
MRISFSASAAWAAPGNSIERAIPEITARREMADMSVPPKNHLKKPCVFSMS